MQVRKTNEDLTVLTEDSFHLLDSDGSLSNDETTIFDSQTSRDTEMASSDEDTSSSGYVSNGGYLSYAESDESDEERTESIPTDIRKAFTVRKMDSDKKAFKNNTTKANENNSKEEAREGGYYIEDATTDEDELTVLASSRSPQNSRSLLQTEYGNFKFIKPLGKGEFGEVRLYQYQSDCSTILKFCPNSQLVALKIIEGNHHNEITISDYLAVMEKYFANEFAYFVRPFYLTTYNNKTVLLNEYVSLTPHTLVAKNLQDFLCQLSTKQEYCFELDGKTVNMQNNLVVLLSQLVNSIKQSINAVHNCGIFHLDIGCRNFVVTITMKDGKPVRFQVKAIDFGHAHVTQNSGKVTLEKKKRVIRAMNRNSIANHSSLFLTNNTSSESTKTSTNKSPVASTNTPPEARPQDTATIYTELFSIKACIISMLGLIVGMETEWDALRVETPSEKMSDHARLRNSLYTNDEFTLWMYLQNVKNYINQGMQYKEYTCFYEQVKYFINVFQAYITTLPSSNLSMEEARAVDDRLLLKANESLVDGFVEFQTKNLRTNFSKEDFHQQMLLSLEQLREVPVSPEFSRQNSYKLLENCHNDEALNCILNRTHVVSSERKNLCSSFRFLSHKTTLLGLVNNFRQYLCSNENNVPTASWCNEVLSFIQQKIDYISYQIEEGKFTRLKDIRKFLNDEKENFSGREKDKWSYAFYVFSSLQYIVSSTKAALHTHQGTNDNSLNQGSKSRFGDLKS